MDDDEFVHDSSGTLLSGSPQNSDTVDTDTQPDNPHSGDVDNGDPEDTTESSIHNPSPWHPSIVTYNENANEGINDDPVPQSSSNEDSNQSAFMVPIVTSTLDVEPWRPVLGVYDEDSSTARPLSSASVEDSRSTAVTACEESTRSSAGEECKDDEPPAKVRKLDPSDDGDGETCPICLDTWGNSGDHRLVALKCGHLFGAACVQRWLKAQPARDRACPTCKSRAALRDVRPVYARRLLAADTSQVTDLQRQIEVLQTEKGRLELELRESRMAHRACALQLEGLRSSLLRTQTSKEPPRGSWRFALEKNLEISKDGGCRVLAYNCRTYEFYVSQRSTNGLFPGYGVRRVSCVDYRPGQFVHLHPRPIRDIAYSQPRDQLLSVGLDNTARILERGAPGATVQCRLPLWSCAWDCLRADEFYVGGVGGVVDQYDVRNPGSRVRRLGSTGDLSPVVALRSTELGLLSCQLNSCWLWAGAQREPRALPVAGPFMSLSYDAESQRALVSCRGGGGERGRLALCRLRSDVAGGDVVCDVERSFAGSARSSVMSRGAWVRAPGAAWAAAHSEAEAALYLHGLDGARTLALPAAEPVLDVCSARLNGDTVLAALSESRLRLYKAVPAVS